MAHVKSLLVMLLERLELKFSSFALCTEDDIDSMWSKLLIVDSALQKNESLTKKNLTSKQGLMAFLKHCCTHCHYSFQIKKCSSDTCDICKPVRLPKEVFDTLPDPLSGEDGHCKSLDDLLGTETDEVTDPFSASIQHVMNVDLMLQCDKCAMWRLLYSFQVNKKGKV